MVPVRRRYVLLREKVFQVIIASIYCLLGIREEP